MGKIETGYPLKIECLCGKSLGETILLIDARYDRWKVNVQSY